jgi:hypothetical protein
MQYPLAHEEKTYGFVDEIGDAAHRLSQASSFLILTAMGSRSDRRIETQAP